MTAQMCTVAGRYLQAFTVAWIHEPEEFGKQANCQVAVSVHAVSDTASCPNQWRLFLPPEWDADAKRRLRTGVPDVVRHVEKWQLALDEAAASGMRPPVVVADAAYGQNALFRAG
ncbi:hypothetical protein B4N89_45795 [Embleya scabrispora]|uniref:Transposase IS701-like DDE domain-containing protein n=1 Tax=Embleya scabrispora TaxID=159449 RepID=A0A1T3NJ19_9ACTN|nr:hypothetical protein B4N89_45795 [Embleya scabrispora]